MKQIDFSRSVADLVNEYPEIKDIMVDLGFKDITKPIALKVMSKMMTIPKGAEVKGIDLDEIVAKFEENGFFIIGYSKTEKLESYINDSNETSNKTQEKTAENTLDETSNNTTEKTPEMRQQLLQNMIERLSQGEDLEEVRKDFVKDFSNVSVHEIANAEQNLIRNGMPVAKVQSLCDIHSALFHGKTEAEIWREEEEKAKKLAEKEKQEKEKKEKEKKEKEQKEKEKQEIFEREQKIDEARMQMAHIDGSNASDFKVSAEDAAKIRENVPIRILQLENQEIETRIMAIEEIYNNLEKCLGEEKNGEVNEDEINSLVAKLRDLKIIAKHYSKKEELFFPNLSRHGYPGPSDVMWGVDDEIKGDISFLVKFLTAENVKTYMKNLKRVINRVKEMIYKEENILFPLAVETFTEEEWFAAYRDYDEMGYAFITEIPRWDKGLRWIEDISKKEGMTSIEQGKIKMPTGEITVKQLRNMLEIIPIDLTFIDENEILRFFTNKEKVFSRPLSALGKKVYECHPPRIIPVVEALIEDFKNKCNDKMEIWMDRPGNPVKITYHAVYDEDGKYIGTLEMVQSFKDVVSHLESSNSKMPSGNKPF